MLRKDSIAILGVPLDNLAAEDAADRIIRLIEDPAKGPAKYVSSLHLSALSRLHFCFSSEAKDPELLECFREASLLAGEGAPILLLSWLLGSPLKTRISMPDLFEKLVDKLGQEKKSVFLLGDSERTVKVASAVLTSLNPGLKIAGTSAQHIYISGESMEGSYERDELLVEQINHSGADLLVLNLGFPKQEIWFSRVKSKLKIPVCIGVGRVLEAISGAAPSAPRWMDRIGLSWLYKFLREPGSLFRGSSVDFFKLLLILPPLIFYNAVNKIISLFFKLFHSYNLDPPMLFLSADRALSAIPLPFALTKKTAQELSSSIEDAFLQDLIVLDFSKVKDVSLQGLSLLILLWLKAKQEGKLLLALSPTADLIFLFKMHKIWDCAKHFACQDTSEVMCRISVDGYAPSLYDSIRQVHRHAIISLLGKLDGEEDYHKFAGKLAPVLYGKDCIVDLTYCTELTNSGLVFLLSLRKKFAKQSTIVKLCGLRKAHWFKLKQAGLDHLFVIGKDVEDTIKRN